MIDMRRDFDLLLEIDGEAQRSPRRQSVRWYGGHDTLCHQCHQRRHRLKVGVKAQFITDGGGGFWPLRSRHGAAAARRPTLPMDARAGPAAR